MSSSPEERLNEVVRNARLIVRAARARDPQGVIDGAAAISKAGDRIFSEFSDDDWRGVDPLLRYSGWKDPR